MSEAGHTRWRLLLQADHDGELDAAASAELEAHVAICASCTADRRTLSLLSDQIRARATRYAAPETLIQALAPQTAKPVQTPFSWITRQAPGMAIGIALAASVAIAIIPPRPDPAGSQTKALVSAHVRGLMPGHLLDVVSTDRHTVKPWFDGRLDYAPPVRDFAAQGYPLKGARLDTLEARPVAALVYGRDKHLIDLFVWPGDSRRAGKGLVRGYNFTIWGQSGMVFCAVSDLNAEELDAFAALWRAG